MTSCRRVLFLAAVLVLFIFYSCSTFSGTPHEKPDYTDEQIRLSEISNIRRMIPNNSVKALWLAYLLVQESVPNEKNGTGVLLKTDEAADDSSNAIGTLFDECVSSVMQEMEKAVSGKQWYEAEKLCSTLLCVCGLDSVPEEKRAEIREGLAGKTLPSAQNAIGVADASVVQNVNVVADVTMLQSADSAELPSSTQEAVPQSADSAELPSTAPQSADSAESPSSTPVAAPKTSDFIKGTVTIWVDKGVTVQNRVGYSEVSLGSGFFIDEGGYIITNYHVVQSEVDPKYEGYSRLYIKLAGKSDERIPAKVIGWDASCDLALVKADVKPGFVFSLGSASDLEVGDRIIAVGSPLGLEHTVTSGIISAVGRDVGMPGKVIQIDAAVNSGNSGGPVVDENGKVQGVVFAGLLEYQGLNFVIPVETLKAELPALFCGGEVLHPWIGISGRTKRVYPSDENGIGVEVLYVLPAGIADYAGIAVGDIICSFDGTPVKDMDDLHNAMIPDGTNRIVDIELFHDETESSPQNRRTVKVYLEKRPEYPGYTICTNDLLYKAFYPVVGMELVPVSSARVGKYAVKSVIKGSVADESGFSDGDPVEIISAEPAPDKSYLYVEVYAKKRRKGYLDVTLGFAVPLDSTSFF